MYKQYQSNNKCHDHCLLCTCEAKKRLNCFGGKNKLEQQISGRSYNTFHETNLGNAFKSFIRWTGFEHSDDNTMM